MIKEHFKITGLFYEIQGYKFRKYLDIKKVETTLKTPDLMVVMMNPGSSRPLNNIDNSNVETEAMPDNTQSQIMQIMQICDFKYCRVLNLSDLREPKSNEFYKKMAELKFKSVAHSIFDKSRKVDFNNLWVSGVPVIYAWGVSDNLKPLALKAMQACNASNPYGILKASTNWAYYHPLPPVYSKQEKWVNIVSQQLNNIERKEYYNYKKITQQ